MKLKDEKSRSKRQQHKKTVNFLFNIKKIRKSESNFLVNRDGSWDFKKILCVCVFYGSRMIRMFLLRTFIDKFNFMNDSKPTWTMHLEIYMNLILSSIY